MSGALIERGDAFRLDIVRPFPPIRRIIVEEHPPFAPIEHVDHQDDIPLAHEFRRQTPAAVIEPLKIRQDRVLVLRLHQLLFAPEVKAAVIMQSNDGRRRKFALLRNQQIRGHSDVWRRVEVDFFPKVISLVDSLYDFRLRLAGGGRIMQQLQEFAPGLPFPGFVAFELRVEKGEWKVRFHRLALDKGKQRANVGLRLCKSNRGSGSSAGRRLSVPCCCAVA